MLRIFGWNNNNDDDDDKVDGDADKGPLRVLKFYSCYNFSYCN